MEFKNLKKITLFCTSIFMFFIICFVFVSILQNKEIKTHALSAESVESVQKNIHKNTNLENSTITSDTTIEAGEIVNNVIVESGTVNIKGTVNNLIVYSGIVNIYDKGTISGTVIFVGNPTKTILNVQSGGRIIDELIIANADVTIEAGATVQDILLENEEVRDTVHLDIMGTVTGNIILKNRGTSCVCNLSGSIDGMIQSIGSIVNIKSNVRVQNVLVTSNAHIGKVNVQSNAIIESIEVTVYGGNFGELTVESNATVNTLKVAGGIVNIQSNATIENATVLGYEGYFGELTIEAGASVKTLNLKGGSVDIAGSIETVITTDGAINLLEGGAITNLTIAGKVDLGSGANASGGNISKVVIHETGILTLWDTIKIKDIINDGKLNVAGHIDFIQNTTSGILQVKRGAKIVSLESAGKTVVNAGADINSLKINGGHTYIQQSAIIRNATLHNGILESDNKENIGNLVCNAGTFIDHTKQSHPIQSHPMQSLWIYIIISGILGAIIVGLIVCIIVFLHKKRKKNKSIYCIK